MIDPENIVGIVIAGGQSSRMGGGDKTLEKLGKQTILDYVLNNLGAQLNTIAINTNSTDQAFKSFAKPVFPDLLPDFQGPLAGILSAMRWTLQNKPDATHIVTVAGDSPFFPSDLVAKLAEKAGDTTTIMMAESGGYNHPVFALWPVALAQDLERWLEETGNLKVMAWVRTHNFSYVDFPFENGRDPFFNINTRDDLAAAEALLEEAEA